LKKTPQLYEDFFLSSFTFNLEDSINASAQFQPQLLNLVVISFIKLWNGSKPLPIEGTEL
jgi:hypothetical protein